MVTAEASIASRLIRPLVLFVTLIAIGTIGYMIIERHTLLEGLYMTVITITTVGFKEVRELHPAGRVFTIFIVLFGVGLFTYLATNIANYFIAGELHGVLDRKRMEKQIERISDHFIVCGFGRMGAQVARELRREQRELVVVDQNHDAVTAARAAGFPALVGDAEEDAVLKQVGVERAAGLVACVDSDASNVMVTISARALNEKLFIVARANGENAQSKLVSAGANRVLWPQGLGGRRIAQMAIRPNVVEFLEVVMHDEELELWLEELTIAIDAELDGCAIGEARIRAATGANIVALRQRTGKLLVAPTPETTLDAGDIIVVLGTKPQLAKLREMTTTAARTI